MIRITEEQLSVELSNMDPVCLYNYHHGLELDCAQNSLNNQILMSILSHLF